MNDEIDYPAVWYPTHIVDKDNKLIHVYLGAPQSLLGGLIGLYIKDSDYSRIRHDKAYIFIHDPDVDDDQVQDIDWDKIDDVEDRQTTSRKHIHIWKEPEFGEANVEGGEA
jgi:hypothetical protein